MQPQHANVLDQIRAAFSAEPIRSKGAFDDWGATYLDAEAYSQHISGKTWEELDRAYLVRRHDALGFLGTRHLVAVLPVYLCSLVEEGVWSASADMLMLLLAKPGSEKTRINLARFEALVNALTPAQRTAVAAALRAFAATDEGGSLGEAAHTALEQGWKTYLTDGS